MHTQTYAQINRPKKSQCTTQILISVLNLVRLFYLFIDLSMHLIIYPYCCLLASARLHELILLPVSLASRAIGARVLLRQIWQRPVPLPDLWNQNVIHVMPTQVTDVLILVVVLVLVAI